MNDNMMCPHCGGGAIHIDGLSDTGQNSESLRQIFITFRCESCSSKWFVCFAGWKGDVWASVGESK